jgi:hypothetical protein
MAGLAARKCASQVAELRALADNKRCFNCEALVRRSAFKCYVKNHKDSRRTGCPAQRNPNGKRASAGRRHHHMPLASQGTTYYVPALSIFVCTPCSGIQ